MYIFNLLRNTKEIKRSQPNNFLKIAKGAIFLKKKTRVKTALRDFPLDSGFTQEVAHTPVFLILEV